jgi:hypothetical protein
MNILKRGIPVTIAVLVGLVTLGTVLFVPSIADILLNWAGFVAAAALVMGIVNLLSVHVRRGRRGNPHSVVLVLAMVGVFALAITDGLGLTQQGVITVFNLIQVPLEAALASLLAFFLLFAAVRMMRHRAGWATILFLISTLFFLSTQLPAFEPITSWLTPVRAWIDAIIVISGMRGLLIGIALGIVTLSVRLLIGFERPYSS